MAPTATASTPTQPADTLGRIRNRSGSPSQFSSNARSTTLVTSSSSPDLSETKVTNYSPDSHDVNGSDRSRANVKKVKSKRFKSRKGSYETVPIVGAMPPSLSLVFGDESPTGEPEHVKQPSKALTPAAAVALQASAPSAKDKPASPYDRLDAIRSAKLTVTQAHELLRLVGVEVKQRGLDTIIFRPFRVSESQQKQAQLLQLFLLSVDPEQYSSIFSVADAIGKSPVVTSFTIDVLEPADPATELKRALAAANIHDVVAIFKWSLRHLDLHAMDMGSSKPYSWYERFVVRERETNYPSNAFSALLLPRLPPTTAAYLDEVLSLCSSVAAHHVANAMPASKLCNILGYWFMGRIGAEHPPLTLDELTEAWSKGTSIMQHLLLAYIHDTAAKTHLMPTRLTELVANYPYIAPGTSTPSLPVAFTAPKQRALRMALRSDNVVVNSRKPRSASLVLRSALQTRLSNADEPYGNAWSSLLERVPNLGQASDATDDRREDDTEEERQKDVKLEAEMFSEEHARVLKLVAKELRQWQTLAEGGSSSPTEASAPSDADASRRRMRSADSNVSVTSQLSNFRTSPNIGDGTMSASSVYSTLSDFGARQSGSLNEASMRSRVQLVSLPEDQDLSTQQPEGWMNGLANMGDESLDLSLPDYAVTTTPASIGRSKRSNGLGSLRRKGRGSTLPPLSNGGAIPAAFIPPPPSFTLTPAGTLSFDDSFASMWLDQLLDPALPRFVLVQLKTLLRTPEASVRWLLIEETVIPPRPPMPHGTGANGSADSSSVAERRSLAPSLRSITASLRKITSFRRRGRKSSASVSADDLHSSLASPSPTPA